MYALYDFKKAFDIINTSLLWNVLRMAGVGKKNVKNLQSLNKIAKPCVPKVLLTSSIALGE